MGQRQEKEKEMILIKSSFEILSAPENLDLIELAARTCYKTENKLGSNPLFIEGIIARGHESVIEHLNITVKFICDRGVTHELVRHRLCSFSQESTRYCNYKGGVTFILPVWMNDYQFFYEHNFPYEYHIWFEAMERAENDYLQLLKQGWSPQQARSVLPNSLKTEIIVTANMREWRHILRLRTSKSAHPQMREIMIPLLLELREKYPIMFNEVGETK